MNYDIFKIKENLYLAPVLHGSIFFTLNLKKMLEELNPDIIALELPSWAKNSYIKAVKILPQITVMTYKSRDNKNYYIPIEPVDAFTEAVRFALERNKKIAFIDSDAVSYYEHYDPFYGNFFIEKENWEDFFNRYKDFKYQKSKEDELRERTMAFNLKKLILGNEKIVAVTGMAHYKGIVDNLDNGIVSFFTFYKPVPSLKSISPDNLAALLSDYPILNWFYENYRNNVSFSLKADLNQIKASFFKIIKGHYNNYEEVYKESCEKLYRKIVIEGKFFDFEKTDRRNLLYEILKEAGRLYKARYKDEFYNWQLRNIVKFARNISILKNMILPDTFTLLESAKANVDDNYTWELMKILEYYPFQPEESFLEQIDINEFNDYRAMYIRRRDKRMPKNPLKRRKTPKNNEEWSKDFKRGDICSYQPEDIIIENFADFIKLKAKRQLLSELLKTEKFSTSMFEGIDIKETIRKQDGIYVKKYEKLGGDVGNVVFIFDYDENGDRYKYKMTWLGEHEQESDMAFYSTEIGEDIIGPGISRCEYGGFMLSYPPRRLYDVWSDPDYAFLEKKEDKLLVAAIDYSVKKYVVYVAKKPPKSRIVSWGKRIGIEVVYIPLGSLSKSTINKIRIFHVLAGHGVRDYADDYIF